MIESFVNILQEAGKGSDIYRKSVKWSQNTINHFWHHDIAPILHHVGKHQPSYVQGWQQKKVYFIKDQPFRYSAPYISSYIDRLNMFTQRWGWVFFISLICQFLIIVIFVGSASVWKSTVFTFMLLSQKKREEASPMCIMWNQPTPLSGFPRSIMSYVQ